MLEKKTPSRPQCLVEEKVGLEIKATYGLLASDMVIIEGMPSVIRCQCLASVMTRRDFVPPVLDRCTQMVVKVNSMLQSLVQPSLSSRRDDLSHGIIDPCKTLEGVITRSSRLQHHCVVKVH